VPRQSQSALFAEVALAATEAVVFCVLTSLLASVAGLAAPVAMFVIAAWYVAAFAVQRILRAVGVSWKVWLTAAILLAVIAILLGAKLVLGYAYDFTDLRWLEVLGASVVAGGNTSVVTIVVLVGVALVWGRASWLGHSLSRFRTTAQSFQAGIAILVLVYGIAALLERDIPSAIPLGLAFFFFGTLSIAVSHRQEVASRGDRRAEELWLWLLMASVILALLVGALVGLLLDGNLLRQIVAAVAALFDLIGQLLLFLVNLFPQDASSQAAPAPPPPLPPVNSEQEGLPNLFSDEMRQALQFCWMAGFLAFLGFGAVRLLANVFTRLFRAPALAGATVEKVPTRWRDEILALLRALRGLFEDLQWGLHRRRRSKIDAESGISGDVRDAYRALLYWAAKRGLLRTDQETPYEYLQRLAVVIPSGEDDLRILTDSYILARYCPQLLTEEDCGNALDSWCRLRRVLRRAPTHHSPVEASER
jgi:hypothetical protein